PLFRSFLAHPPPAGDLRAEPPAAPPPPLPARLQCLPARRTGRRMHAHQLGRAMVDRDEHRRRTLPQRDRRREVRPPHQVRRLGENRPLVRPRSPRAAAASRASFPPAARSRTTATASNTAEGAPSSLPSAGRCRPSLSTTPPIFGATIFTLAPAASTALRSAAMVRPLEPSSTRMPTQRPAREGLPLPISRSAGEAGRS